VTAPRAPTSAATDAILLLHGQPGSARDWDGVRAAIGEPARVIAFDRPGWDARTAPTDLVGNVRAAIGMLDARKVDRAIVVGHSFGGAIAAWLAATEPARVAALVLAAPSANVASLNRIDRLLARPLFGPLLGATALAALGAALRATRTRERIGSRFALDGGYLESAGQTLLRPAAWRAFSTEQRDLIRELPALESRLPQISAPTTIAIGTADRIVPPLSARLLAAQIGGAEVVEIPGASHLLPQQHAERLARIILAASRAEPQS
jgi:pimeloyl-ACP methyl ester carboxylesterase